MESTEQERANLVNYAVAGLGWTPNDTCIALGYPGGGGDDELHRFKEGTCQNLAARYQTLINALAQSPQVKVNASSLSDRSLLVVRALKLGWSMSKICRTMGLAGGGSATLRTFEEGRSNDLETKYVRLLAAVYNDDGGGIDPPVAVTDANVTIEEQLKIALAKLGVAEYKLDLMDEELDTTRESLKKARDNIEPQILRDQVVPIIISAGSIVVIVTQYLDGARDIAAKGLLVTSLLGCVAGIVVSVIAICVKRRAEKAQRAMESTNIVGFAVNTNVYHKQSDCGRGKDMPPITVVDGRRLCNRCGGRPLAPIQQAVGERERSTLVVRALQLGWSMSKICRTIGLAGGGSATLRTFEEGRSKNTEVKYALLLAAVSEATRNQDPIEVSNYPNDLHERVGELQRQFDEKKKIINPLRDLFLPCVTYAGSIITVITQYYDVPGGNMAKAFFIVTVVVQGVAMIALIALTMKRRSDMQRLSEGIAAGAPFGSLNARQWLDKVVVATTEKLEELDKRFEVRDQWGLIVINTWSLFIVFWQYFHAPTSPESRYSAIGLLTTPSLAYVVEIYFLVSLIREKWKGAS
ncbi:Hypothetical protein, putative [Bodo saltans]|uniref:Transmembrane protein n=1 Tax=Bodo saltans TaxID=75058 RepID=A0A0S4JKC6_BODSA|nr:Hypothetical protein, putative [Bodo saltans]|eukprot:CUG89423.1 Hypothetical protein, putative [Bodo saltans]